MPDYAHVHKELQRSGVTLNLLWLEYCDQCRAAGEIPYQSTQFNKYYADYLAKVNATMHLNHKPGEVTGVPQQRPVGAGMVQTRRNQRSNLLSLGTGIAGFG